MSNDAVSEDQAGGPAARETRPPVSCPEASRPPDDRCGMCGYVELEPYVRGGRHDVNVCPRCRSTMVTGRTTPSAVNDDADRYFRAYSGELSAAKPLACFDLFRSVTGRLPGGISVLDIGCGDGAFLDIARASGMETAGIDISAEAVNESLEKGHAVHAASITDGPFPGGRLFDFITMWDVLEHIPMPGKAIRNVRKSLKPGGMLIVLSPMSSSVYDRLGVLLFRLTGKRFDRLINMCWNDKHLYRFHRDGVAAAFAAAGYSDTAATPVLLTSLDASSYAGGDVLGSWTGRKTIDRAISRTCFGIARSLDLHNKILITVKAGER